MLACLLQLFKEEGVVFIIKKSNLFLIIRTTIKITKRVTILASVIKKASHLCNRLYVDA